MSKMFQVQQAYEVSVSTTASTAKQALQSTNYKITNRSGGDDILIVWGSDNTVEADNTVTDGAYPVKHAFVPAGSIQTLSKDLNDDWFSIICLTGTANVVVEVGSGE